MKQSPSVFLLLLLILAGSIACSRTQKTEKTASAQLRTHKEAVDTLRSYGDEDEEEAQGATESEKPLEMVSSDASSVLTAHNLNPLLSPNAEEGEAYAYNGFYGNDHYRIEIYFASVTKDEHNPGLYHVTGKSRYKKNITPFEGEIVLAEVKEFHDPNISAKSMEEMEIKNTYMASGTFVLREDSSSTGSGTFKGTVALDFAVKNDNSVRTWFFSETEGAQGAGFVFDGEWTSYKTGKSKPVTWAKDIFMIANGILENFSIGERDVEINPKYRKLGWDNFWENDEWWNDQPSARL